jgi:hypothetical protein
MMGVKQHSDGHALAAHNLAARGVAQRHGETWIAESSTVVVTSFEVTDNCGIRLAKRTSLPKCKLR